MDLLAPKFLEHGLLGVVIVAQLVAILRLFNLLVMSWGDRIREGKESQAMLNTTLDNVRGLVAEVRDLRREMK